jgi:hypothetical protein
MASRVGRINVSDVVTLTNFDCGGIKNIFDSIPITG